MNTPESDAEAMLKWHQTIAKETNHLVWDLLSKPERSQAEDAQMLNAAHTSCFHWEKVGTPVHLTRGNWMISHVYAILNQPALSLQFAKSCLEICQQNMIGDFDLAYAYEAMARAFASLGQKDECQHYLQLAEEAGQQIQNIEPKDREIFFNDFIVGPWFGMK